MKEKLTVIIPCKNERNNIGACIDSARRVADEVLVADSGSTDGTLEIVRQLGGCRVIQREYVNSGNFKNWAIPQAGHPWVLIVDADERFTQPLADEINFLLAVGPAHQGYYLYRTNYFLGRRVRFSGWRGDKVLRLFRRDLGRYAGESDHAQLELASGNAGYLKHPLQHFTYWTLDQYFLKFHRYTVQSAQNKHAAGRRASYGRMLLAPPLRFLHCYVVRLGFLDGMTGLQVCALAAMATFVKQARLWELDHALPQADGVVERAAADRADRQAA